MNRIPVVRRRGFQKAEPSQELTLRDDKRSRDLTIRLIPVEPAPEALMLVRIVIGYVSRIQP